MMNNIHNHGDANDDKRIQDLLLQSRSLLMDAQEHDWKNNPQSLLTLLQEWSVVLQERQQLRRPPFFLVHLARQQKESRYGNHHHHHNDETDNDVQAVMDDLYDAWSAQVEFPPPSSSASSARVLLSESQAPLLPLWLQVYTNLASIASSSGKSNSENKNKNHQNARRTLSILEGWTLCFGAHLEWQPIRHHYDWVLQAHAHCGGDANEDEERLEAAEVAFEIIQLLEEWSFTMKPTLSTYLWALQCCASCCDVDEPNSSSSSSQSKTAALLEKVMQRAEHALLSDQANLLHGSGGSSNGNNGGSHNDEEQQLVPLFLETLSRMYRAGAAASTNAAKIMMVDGPTWTPWLQAWRVALADPANRFLLVQCQSSSSLSTLSQPQEQFESESQRQYDQNMLLEFVRETSRDVWHLLDTTASAASAAGDHSLRLGTVALEMQQLVLELQALQTEIDAIATEADQILQIQDYVRVMQAWKAYLSSLPDTSQDDTEIQEVRVRMEELAGHAQACHQRQITGVMTTPEQITANCNSLMQAFLLSGAYRDVFRVHGRMVQEKIQWNATSLALLFQAAAESRHKHLLQRSVAILGRTVQATPNNGRYVDLEMRHFSILLQGLAATTHKNASVSALQVFAWLQKESKEESSNIIVTKQHYADLATTLSRSSDANMAEEIMKLMERMAAEDGIFEPNDQMRSAWVVALGRQHSVATAQKAEEMYTKLRKRGQSDVRTAVAVMYAWINSGDNKALDRVEEIFSQLLEDSNQVERKMKPTKFAFRALLEAWARFGRKEGATRAVEILQEYETMVAEGLTADGDFPDVRLFTAAMRAVWKSQVPDAPVIVEALYDRLVQAANANPGDLKIQPDTKAMTALMQTWAGSFDPNKARHVLNKWMDLQAAFEQGNLKMKPSEYAAAAVLHACVFTPTKAEHAVRQEALDVALRVWQDIRNLDLVNDVLVTLLLRILGRHVEDYEERVRLTSVAFQHACLAGCVSPTVIDALRQYTPTMLKELPMDSQMRLTLPEQWTARIEVTK